MPVITHFMVPADDMERAKKFYAEIFGWKIEKMPGPVEYYGIETTDEDGKKGLGGGLGKRENPSDAIVNYIDVPSIDVHTARVEKLGGKIVMPKTAVPGIGYAAVCLDTENNTFGLWECDEDAKMAQCESCGMPLSIDESTTSKIDNRYCIHCQKQQTGELASREQVREGSINAAIKFMGKTKEEAEKMVDEMMPKLPRWQK
ncbi:MAG: VOC family protein [Actinomycetia bacterium]|nr:VOC family protein [Actinomycetes bacterium]